MNRCLHMPVPCRLTRLAPRAAAWGSALAICMSAQAQPTAPPAPAWQDGIAKVCAPFSEALAPDVDLDVVKARIRQAQSRADASALEEACRAWRLVLQREPPNPRLQLDWATEVAAGLLWLSRSAEALPLFESQYSDYLARGPEQAAQAGTVAGMVSFIHMQRGQSNLALEWSQRGVDALASAGPGVNARDRLRVQINHGSMLSSMRRFDEAETVFRSTLAEALQDPSNFATEAAVAMGGLAMKARRQSRLEEALQEVNREIGWRQLHVADDPVNLINAMQNRGTLLTQLARYDEAEASLRAALKQADLAATGVSVDLFGHLSSLRESLSALLLARGRATEALEVAEEAVRLLKPRPEAQSPRGARPLRRLAESKLALGDLAGGVAEYRHAMVLLKSGSGPGDADTLQAVRLGYARVLLELGDLDEAREALQQAAADPRPMSPEERARHSALQAALAQRRGDTQAALAAWQAADAALAGSLPTQHPQRQILQAQQCELASSHCAVLEQTWADAGARIASEGMPEAEALVRLSLSRRALAESRLQDAVRWAQEAVTAAYSAGQPRLQWPALAALAAAQAASGQHHEAIFFGKLALAKLQEQRERLLPMGSAADARYLTDKTGLYRQVSQWLLASGRLSEAVAVMRLLKQYEQAQFSERANSSMAEVPFSEPEAAALQRFKDHVQSAAVSEELQRLNQLAGAQRITAAEKARLLQLQQIDAAQREVRLAFLAELAATVRVEDKTKPRETLRHRPAAGTLHAYLLAGEQQLTLLLIGHRQSRVVQLPLPLKALAEKIAELRDAVQSRSQVQAHAQALYRSLGRPLVQAAQAESAHRIVLWLDGPLRYLPFGILHDGQNFLAARFQLLLATGEGLSRKSGKTSPPSRHSIAAFGVTQALQGLPALPSVADELCGIVKGPVLGLDEEGLRRCGAHAQGRGPMPGQARLNAHFTEAALRHAAGAGPTDHLLHIGTHFVLRPGQISRSWLLLGDGSRLQLAQMRDLTWGQPGLITLSACETAVSDAGNSGSEVDGMAASLLHNGARRVLASLWRVDDRATARFMQDFYARYARAGSDAAHALQATQRAAMVRGEPAHQWAAFVLLEAEPPRPDTARKPKSG